MRVTRRLLLAIGATFALTPARAATPGLEAALRAALPPGLDPQALGRAMRAGAAAGCDAATCLLRAGGARWPNPARPDWDWIGPAIAGDFAAGRIVAVDGWQLAQTEAWLCAAVAGQPSLSFR